MLAGLNFSFELGRFKPTKKKKEIEILVPE